MKNALYFKIAAVVAAIMGLMALVTGTRVLVGAFVPDYHVLPWLVKYNVTMGAVSVFTGVVLWLRTKIALRLTALVTVAHVTVLALLLTVFHSVVATHSIRAMIFRSVVWLILFVLVWKRSVSPTN